MSDKRYTVTLKPCPFCLKPALHPYRHDQGGWVVTCDNACCLVWRSTHSDAAKDWNKRVTHE